MYIPEKSNHIRYLFKTMKSRKRGKLEKKKQRTSTENAYKDNRY